MITTFYKKIHYFFFMIIIYFFIYSPYLKYLQIGTGKIVLFISLLYLLFNIKSINYITLFKNEIFFVFILIFYSLLTLLWGDGSSTIIPYLHFQFIVDCIFVPVILYKMFNSSIDLKRLNVYLIYVGTIASFITLFLVLNPVVNLYLRENIIVDDLDSGTVQDSLRYIRGFSFSESSTFGFGITQAILFGLALNETKNNSKFFLPLIFFLISILFNARVGFVVAIISLILLTERIKIYSFVYISIVFFGCYLYLNYSDFAIDNSQSIIWATDFFVESFSFFSNEKADTTYGLLIGEMFFFPKNIVSLLFGEGKIVMGKSIGSDVGYVNQIFIGGLLYLFLLLSTLFYCYFNFHKFNRNSFIGVFFLITILIINFKGSALLTSHSFYRLFFLIYVVNKCISYDIIMNKKFLKNSRSL